MKVFNKFAEKVSDWKKDFDKDVAAVHVSQKYVYVPVTASEKTKAKIENFQSKDYFDNI